MIKSNSCYRLLWDPSLIKMLRLWVIQLKIRSFFTLIFSQFAYYLIIFGYKQISAKTFLVKHRFYHKLIFFAGNTIMSFHGARWYPLSVVVLRGLPKSVLKLGVIIWPHGHLRELGDSSFVWHRIWVSAVIYYLVYDVLWGFLILVVGWLQLWLDILKGVIELIKLLVYAAQSLSLLLAWFALYSFDFLTERGHYKI